MSASKKVMLNYAHDLLDEIHRGNCAGGLMIIVTATEGKYQIWQIGEGTADLMKEIHQTQTWKDQFK